jgi:hypothetical protein
LMHKNRNRKDDEVRPHTKIVRSLFAYIDTT